MRIQIPVSTECNLRSEVPFNVTLPNGQYWYYQVNEIRLPAQARGYFVDIEAEGEVETSFHQLPQGEYNDGIPIEMPVTAPETLQDTIARLVRNHMEYQEEIPEGTETFEEANDLDIDEDADPVSQYELTEMQEELPVEAYQIEAEREPNEHTNDDGSVGRDGRAGGGDDAGTQSDPGGESTSTGDRERNREVESGAESQ